MRSDITTAAFLGMVARWAYNTDLNRTDWIMEIWADDPQMARHLADKYESYIPKGENGNEYMQAVIRLICNLDHENLAILADVIEKFVRNGWPTYLSNFEEYDYYQ